MAEYGFVIFGAIVAIMGAYWLIMDAIYHKHGYQTKGKGVKLEERCSSGGLRTTNYTWVKFKTKENTYRTLKLDFSTNPPLFVEGKTIKIVYYENKIYPSGKGWRVFYSMLVGIGISLFIYGLVA
jgi:hypothetical protein